MSSSVHEPVALGRYGAGHALVSRSGELLDHSEDILLIYRPSFAGHARLNDPRITVYDLAELWAFIRPTHAVAPTVQGMAGKTPQNAEDAALLHYYIMDDLLAEARQKWDDLGGWAKALENPLGNAWPWLMHLPEICDSHELHDIYALLKSKEKRLRQDITQGPAPNSTLSLRPTQQAYREALAAHIQRKDNSPFMIAGGTGVGKTRAYLSAALEPLHPQPIETTEATSPDRTENSSLIYVSTYTKHLQQQVQNEAKTHYGLSAHIRKGRDNYICLKNLASYWEIVKLSHDTRQRLGALTMIRWAVLTPDGDFTGGSFPGWLVGLFGFAATLGTADRARECNYTACPFYAPCFIEKARAAPLTAAGQKTLVIANHALIASLPAAELPDLLIMDEAHHVEHVMDEALTNGFSHQSLQRLSRFLHGQSAGPRRRARRGFLHNWRDSSEQEVQSEFDDIIKAVQNIPTLDQLVDRSMYSGNLLTEYLYQLEQQILESQKDQLDSSYDLDADRADAPRPSRALLDSLATLHDTMQTFLTRRRFCDKEARLADPALLPDPRLALFADHALRPVAFFHAQLAQLGHELPNDCIEWPAIRRGDGRVSDVGLYRAWANPLQVWQNIAAAQGSQVVYTTATPTRALQTLTDTYHRPINMQNYESPFDYTAQSKIFVLTDIASNSGHDTARAIAPLAAAANGSTIAIFTAIARLRAVYDPLLSLCDAHNLYLLAQHVQNLDTSTLVDIFRTEPRALLLGTDALRDGMDIPGDPLRLVIMDKVPWSRPTTLYNRRKALAGGRAFEEDIVRLKLRQAFGRLIRTETDRGAFVMLDKRLPSRLYDAFPPGVTIHKCTLSEAAAEITTFLGYSHST